MALWAKHTSTVAGVTQQVTAVSGAFTKLTVVNRSTSALYFTSLPAQGTSADGIPTLNGNHTYYLAACSAVDQPGYFSGKTVFDATSGTAPGTDYFNVSVFCTNTAAQYSIIAE